MDEETAQWLKAEAQRRAADLAAAGNEQDGRRLAEARRLLAKIPPPLPGRTRRFVKVFEAAAPPSLTNAPVTIEGMVFNTYEVESGHLGGDDNFRVFDVITADEEITSWRDEFPEVRTGKAVRIKFIPTSGVADTYDHSSDLILELWIDTP